MQRSYLFIAKFALMSKSELIYTHVKETILSTHAFPISMRFI